MAGELGIVVTAAGLAEVLNAEQNGTSPVALTEIGVGLGRYVPDASRQALESETKRIPTQGGGAAGDNIIHITATDGSTDEFEVYEVGVYTASGTLFAVYSQQTPIAHKIAASQLLLAVDIVLTNVAPESISVGPTNFSVAPATTARLGVIELATAEEVQGGTDAERAVTPATLAACIATAGRLGVVKLATGAGVNAGTDATTAVTPAALQAAFTRLHAAYGFQRIAGGFVLQWGVATIAATGTTVTLPVAFPTACVGAWAVSNGSLPLAFAVMDTTERGNVTIGHNGNGGASAFWWAIGY